MWLDIQKLMGELCPLQSLSTKLHSRVRRGGRHYEDGCVCYIALKLKLGPKCYCQCSCSLSSTGNCLGLFGFRLTVLGSISVWVQILRLQTSTTGSNHQHSALCKGISAELRCFVFQAVSRIETSRSLVQKLMFPHLLLISMLFSLLSNPNTIRLAQC